MPNELYTPSEDMPDSLLGVNKYINCDNTKITSGIMNNQIDNYKGKSREQQRKWHPSKLDGYISDEFRNIELAD